MANVISTDSKGNAVVVNTDNMVGGLADVVNKNAVSNPKPSDPIETLITFFTKLTGTLQVNIYKILWGRSTNIPTRSVVRDPQTGELKMVQGPNPTTTQKISNFFESGVFNILDTINSLDLCNILSYITTTTNGKPRPRSKTPTKAETALYAIQDKAQYVQVQIDRYLALPTNYVRSYAGIEPQLVTGAQAVTGSGAPAGSTEIVGTEVQKFNVYNLLQDIKDTFTVGNANSIITAEDATIISEVPGLGGCLNFVDDFTGFINQYTDYRNISNEDLQKILTKINQIRSICVTIQTLDFKSALALAGNFLGIDIRAQIQKLSKIVDPTKLLPTIKQISNQVRSFVAIARRVYNVLAQLQFIVKIALIFIKVFTFIEVFFTANLLPALFTTSGIQAAFGKARQAANDKTKGLIKRLNQVNGLLSVLISFIRYIVASSSELLTKLDILIATLEGCEAVKDSAVIADLKASYADLKQVQDQLAAYLLVYDGKTNPDNALFGQYSIRVVDEELTDPTIQNKRRRGIAVDQNGALVAQSDLTFATNTQVIIEEVKVKLVSQGLVAPQYSTINASDLTTIAASIDYLESNDILSEDFNFDSLLQDGIDPPDGSNENSGLGLNAFINNLPGGRRLRRRVRNALSTATEKTKAQINQTGVNADKALNTNGIVGSVGTGNETGAGTLTPEDRKRLISVYQKGILGSGPKAWASAKKQLEADEAAGGPGRNANPKTGLPKT